MKLALTKKYIAELKEKYGTSGEEYAVGYGVNRIFFNFIGPEGRMLFINEKELIIVYLNSLTLNVKNVQKFILNANVKLEFKKGVMTNKLKVMNGEQVVFKTLINKKLIGFGDMQKSFNNYLADRV